ncbi:MAG TPA: hypothetical protein VFN95_00085 [Flavitalea sp.]|nr:hypothetical protein [Flavitalea sp.]
MKTILVSSILFVSSLQAISQCDKKVTWYGSKGEMFDTNGTLLDTKVDSIFFETDPQKITLRFKTDQQSLEGTVMEKTCDWKEPFKNGKTVYHTTVSVDGRTSNAIFTVEAKDQKITLSLDIKAMEGRKFLIYLDRYEEAK